MTRTTLRTRRCRTLTIAGTLVAVLAASSAQAAAPAPATAAAPTKAEQSPSLVREVATQIELAYRMHFAERQLRQEQLAAAVNAWRAAPRNEANNERLNNWLHAAIRNSMPGSREALPPLPIFAGASNQHATVDAAKHGLPAAQATTTVNKPTPAKAVSTAPAKAEVTPQHNAAADPFRDDPADKQQ